MIAIITGVLISLGLITFAGGTLGIIRFPDFYSRLHPAGKMDTMASLLILGGLALFEARHLDIHGILTGMKLILITVFVFLASPTATHAIVDAGFRAGLPPWEKEQAQEK